MANKDRIYFDSCCFIDMAKIDLGRIDEGITEDRQKDAWVLRRLCDAALNRDIEIITSTITIAECYHAGEDGHISERAKELFTKILCSGKIAVTVSADIFVNERARDLYWKDRIKLAGADSIHVASALMTNCKEFITTDDRMLKPKWGEAIPKINKLGLKVKRASETLLLPQEYRQDNLEEHFGNEEGIQEEAE